MLYSTESGHRGRVFDLDTNEEIQFPYSYDSDTGELVEYKQDAEGNYIEDVVNGKYVCKRFCSIRRCSFTPFTAEELATLDNWQWNSVRKRWETVSDSFRTPIQPPTQKE